MIKVYVIINQYQMFKKYRLPSMPVLHNWCVVRPYQVCRRVFVTFVAHKQKCFFLKIFLQIDKPQPQYLQQIIVDFRPEDPFFHLLFLFFEITSIMVD